MDDHRTDDALGQVREGVHQLAETAPTVARAEARAEVRRWFPRIVIAAAVVAALVVAGVGYAITDLYFRSAATDAAVTTLRQQADAAKKAGDKANGELQARGQEPVPIPTPGTVPDTNVIAQSATAQVLASLAGQYVPYTALGPAIARYFAANPVTAAGPTPEEMFTSLAAYLAANPLPSGPEGKAGADGANGKDGAAGKDGAPGKDGHTPTADEIQAIFSDYLHQHPEALCPNGGSFAQIRVQLADGGAADTWQCVVATYPAPSKTPTTTPTPPGG
ncbi:hypothetical protein L3Q65_46185 [Amycolatopsis sp. FU40]|uniref:hypothetical protein n=1 Tax=Amycolatopsis sp. FU40 TaxID=2914159 RepID=UPI001F1F28C4|nr:hypothetical protein [Amycolatopsis sp. FU40]UKD55165.1 hypothetical protein L3Q65_46185 [Amycolatopsis sp. FU40]